MNDRVPRRVTRGYAQGLVAAAALFAIALLVPSWGFLALWLDRDPITSTVSNLTAPGLVVACLAIFVFLLWRELVSLIKGNRPTWLLAIVVPGLAYLVWCLAGMMLSLSIEETWLSPFALALVGSWLVSLLIFWWILLRRLYSGKGRPQWPWEKNEREEGPDWFKDGMP